MLLLVFQSHTNNFCSFDLLLLLCTTSPYVTSPFNTLISYDFLVLKNHLHSVVLNILLFIFCSTGFLIDGCYYCCCGVLVNREILQIVILCHHQIVSHYIMSYHTLCVCFRTLQDVSLSHHAISFPPPSHTHIQHIQHTPTHLSATHPCHTFLKIGQTLSACLHIAVRYTNKHTHHFV